MTNQPTLDYEALLWRSGYHYVAGVDEVGRGALAGPVVAAAVIVPPKSLCQGVWAEVRDSKLLSAAQRAALAPQIQTAALAWGVGRCEAMLIDQIGIAAATRRAMQAAVEALAPRPDYLLIDWVRLPMLAIAQESRSKADRDFVSVAAASILAKVARDGWMEQLGDRFPLYGFAGHKGYATQAHCNALAQHGPCPEHRHTFAPIAQPLTLFAEGADGSF
ncbi:MAG TPA: ribonuclease HII [Caldilineaceae bacterium]|nr:ribonuclease HII [Caldilineaceae bacterium]